MADRDHVQLPPGYKMERDAYFRSDGDGGAGCWCAHATSPARAHRESEIVSAYGATKEQTLAMLVVHCRAHAEAGKLSVEKRLQILVNDAVTRRHMSDVNLPEVLSILTDLVLAAPKKEKPVKPEGDSILLTGEDASSLECAIEEALDNYVACNCGGGPENCEKTCTYAKLTAGLRLLQE